MIKFNLSKSNLKRTIYFVLRREGGRGGDEGAQGDGETAGLPGLPGDGRGEVILYSSPRFFAVVFGFAFTINSRIQSVRIRLTGRRCNFPMRPLMPVCWMVGFSVCHKFLKTFNFKARHFGIS